MSIATMFGFSTKVDAKDTELPLIFPLAFKESDFVSIDVENIYRKILTDVLERTHGLKEDQASLLWDNCLASSKSDGLVTMLARAMRDQKDLFLVYDSGISVVREATGTEADQIKKDYKEKAESEVGIFVSFKNYKRSEMIKLYSSLEFATIASLHKSQNLSKSIQIKIADLRKSVAAFDAEGARTQAREIATALSKGQDTFMDAADSIVTATPQLDSTKAAIAFLDAKRSFYLGLPSSYINGEQTGGIGSTGEGDQKATERGLKGYYFTIVKPVCEELFSVKLKYKTQDFRQITQGLEALKTFELVSDQYISAENKKQVVETLFDLDADDNETDGEGADDAQGGAATTTPPRVVGGAS